MDTSTLFFAYCQKYFLKDNGTIAFVLPKTTILPSKQHIRFQKIGFSEIHDFTDVSPLFNVRSILLVRNNNVLTSTITPCSLYQGVLPKKNMEWDKASPNLTVKSGTWEFLDSGVQSEYYYDKFLQGATIVPRCFWFVQPDKTAATSKNAPYMETSDEALEESKEAWKMRLNGRLEKEFIFETILAKGILPFCITRTESVFIPLMKSKIKPYMVDGEALLSEGKTYAAKWMADAEKIWDEKDRKNSVALLKWLNYRKKITAQNVDAPYVLLYNTSGTNLAAALFIKKDHDNAETLINGFIAESVTYYFYPTSINEGDYLASILNSDIVNDLIKAFQPEGLYGPRHIHRRPFEVCAIPQFDNTNAKHTELANLGKECRLKMQGIGPDMKGRLGRLRTGSRKIMSHELSKINTIVIDLLKEQGQKSKVQSSIKQIDNQSELF